MSIQIREHLKEDIPYRVRWFNNPLVDKFVAEEVGQGTNLKKQEKWFIDYERASKEGKKKFFTICDEDKPVGVMGLSSISTINRNANLFIAIGEDNYRGKGVGKIAMQWLIDYGFKELNLHKINLGVIEKNVAAVKLYERMGFVVEGRMKEEVFVEGELVDFLSMARFK